MADQMVTVHQLKLEYGEYVRGMKQAANAAAELAKARSTEAIADAKAMRQTEMYLAAVSRREATEARTAATIERLERQKARAIEKSTRAYRQQSQAVDKNLGVFQKAQKQAASVESQNAEIRRGVILAGQQFQDFAIQVAGGQSVMLAAAQQGSQLHYQLSTMTVGLRQFGAAFLRMVVNPITLGIAAFAGLAYALVNTETKMRELNKLTTQFSLAGMNFDTKELQEFVKQMDALPGVSRKAALGIVGAFSGTEISQDLIKPALDQVKQLSVAIGEDLPKAGESLAGWLRSPSSAVDDLRKRFSAFRGESGDTIKSLEEMGDISGAQAKLLETLAKSLKDVDDSATPLQKAINDLVNSWKNSESVQKTFEVSTKLLTSTLGALASSLEWFNNNNIDWTRFVPPLKVIRAIDDIKKFITGDNGESSGSNVVVGKLTKAESPEPSVDSVNWSKLIEDGRKYNKTLNERANLIKSIAYNQKQLDAARAAGKPDYELAQAESAIAEQRKKLADMDKKSSESKAKSVSMENKLASDMAEMNKKLIESAASLNAEDRTKIEQMQDLLASYSEVNPEVAKYVELQIEQAKATERQIAADEVRQEKIAYMVDQQKRFNDIIDKTPTGQTRKLSEEMQFLHDQFMQIRDSFPNMEEWSESYREALSVVTGRTKEATEEMSEFWKQAAKNMQDSFADFLFDPFKDGLDGMLLNFVNMIHRLASEALAAKVFEKLSGTLSGSSNGFLGFLGSLLSGARADGGPVSNGKSYLVGERGPEIFTPSASGVITPNHEINSSSPVVNVRNINVLDPSVVGDYLGGDEGEQLIMNVVRRNRGALSF